MVLEVSKCFSKDDVKLVFVFFCGNLKLNPTSLLKGFGNIFLGRRYL